MDFSTCEKTRKLNSKVLITKLSFLILDLLAGSSNTIMAFSYGQTQIVCLSSPSEGGSITYNSPLFKRHSHRVEPIFV